jgi:ABC-type uncharacterized transport system permease subunit
MLPYTIKVIVLQLLNLRSKKPAAQAV